YGFMRSQLDTIGMPPGTDGFLVSRALKLERCLCVGVCVCVCVVVCVCVCVWVCVCVCEQRCQAEALRYQSEVDGLSVLVHEVLEDTHTHASSQLSNRITQLCGRYPTHPRTHTDGHQRSRVHGEQQDAR